MRGSATGRFKRGLNAPSGFNPRSLLRGSATFFGFKIARFGVCFNPRSLLRGSATIAFSDYYSCRGVSILAPSCEGALLEEYRNVYMSIMFQSSLPLARERYMGTGSGGGVPVLFQSSLPLARERYRATSAWESCSPRFQSSLPLARERYTLPTNQPTNQSSFNPRSLLRGSATAEVNNFHNHRCVSILAPSCEGALPIHNP